MQLAGSHVLVTGGSRGIGRALASALAARGAQVTIVARKRAQLEAAAAEIGADWIEADLAAEDGLAGLVARAEERGPVDVLVNNAGLDAVGTLADADADGLRQLWNLNVIAPAELSRQALPGMIERGRGRLVFISSLSAEVALPGLTSYSATKAAVSQFADGLRTELAPTGVGVTLVELGAVGTELYETVRVNQDTARAFDRVHKLRMLRELTVDEVVTGVVKALEKDRGAVVLPRRGRTQYLMARAPQRISRLMRISG